MLFTDGLTSFTHTHTQAMAPPPMQVQTVDGVKKFFEVPVPEGSEESRMEELVRVMINNDINVNEIGSNGFSLLNDAIKVRL